ncbi:hypothetical protein ACP4OV_002893 [Aristida adscensionis]
MSSCTAMNVLKRHNAMCVKIVGDHMAMMQKSMQQSLIKENISFADQLVSALGVEAFQDVRTQVGSTAGREQRSSPHGHVAVPTASCGASKSVESSDSKTNDESNTVTSRGKSAMEAAVGAPSFDLGLEDIDGYVEVPKIPPVCEKKNSGKLSPRTNNQAYCGGLIGMIIDNENEKKHQTGPNILFLDAVPAPITRKPLQTGDFAKDPWSLGRTHQQPRP